MVSTDLVNWTYVGGMWTHGLGGAQIGLVAMRATDSSASAGPTQS